MLAPLYGGEVCLGQVLNPAVEGESADGAGHGRVGEGRAVPVQVGVHMVVGRQEIDGGQVLRQGPNLIEKIWLEFWLEKPLEF